MTDINIDIMEAAEDWDNENPTYDIKVNNLDAKTVCKLKLLLIDVLERNGVEVNMVTGTVPFDKQGKPHL